MKFEDKFNLNRVDPLLFTKADVNLTIGIALEDPVVLPSIYSSRHIQRALALAPSLEIKEVKWFDHPDIAGVQVSSGGKFRTNFKLPEEEKLPAIKNLPVIEVSADPSDHQGFCREILLPTTPGLCILGLRDSEPDVSGVWEAICKDGTKVYLVAIEKETNICAKLDQVPGQLGTDRVVGAQSSARTHVLASYVKNGALQGLTSIRKILNVIPAASGTGMKYEVCLPEGIHKLVPVSGEPVCYVRVSRTGLESWRRDFMGAAKAATTWNKEFHAAQEVLRGKVTATLVESKEPAPPPPSVATDVAGIYQVKSDYHATRYLYVTEQGYSEILPSLEAVKKSLESGAKIITAGLVHCVRNSTRKGPQNSVYKKLLDLKYWPDSLNAERYQVTLPDGIYQVHYQTSGALPKFVRVGRSYETGVRDTIEQVKVASRTTGNYHTAVLVLDGKVTTEVIESK